MFPCLKEYVVKKGRQKWIAENGRSKTSKKWSKMGDENDQWQTDLDRLWFQWNIDALRPDSNHFGEWKSKEAYPIRMHLWINNRVHGRSPVGIGPDLPESIPLRKEINLQRFNFK